MSDYERWNRFRAFEEGRDSDDPNDRGGETWYGISRVFYDALQRRGRYLDVPWPPTAAQAATISKTEFWDILRADDLPFPVNVALADWCFNSGDPHGASDPEKELQRQVGVEADGAIGDKTVAAVKRVCAQIGPRALAEILNEKRMRYCMNIAQKRPSQVAFIEGWAVRVLRIDRLSREA